MARGLVKLCPGVYVDKDAAMHIVFEELLQENGYSDNPHNREMVLQALREQLPGVDICEVA